VNFVEQRPFGVDESIQDGQQHVDEQQILRFAHRGRKQLTGDVILLVDEKILQRCHRENC
jgi:hypothetical protein